MRPIPPSLRVAGLAALLLGAAAHARGGTSSAAQERARGLRVVVSVLDRRLWAIADDDTLLTAPVAVGSDAVLQYEARRWRFATPRGQRRVVRKDSLPVWTPPEWHYYEVAREHGLAVRRLAADRPVTLSDGRRLEIRRAVVGVVDPDGTFAELPVDEEIVFDGALFIPPLGTRNRRIAGELGRYRLDLGDGVSIHGTPWKESIGQAVTHGCIRVGDVDMAWLYEFIPVGTRVFIY
ncbi:ErfK/YbiS/YcfS/YnhG family protein (plasmid) [Gemmatirosa kalamazoonensis]|uniref:ErfK/YbiS/YcfS/YnhG family protein n=1 Tax=Gemmatirosa kalamazoonensis TaxID=861299 RepID=W0RSM9_9BACT|nr:L,D-transpeptidase [Gemmatirosa kalamazoonensis]AHG92593.1 ErfK/YbiS/YcfS/YnhG family protein [Gemmatirosa kalamazoonensis]